MANRVLFILGFLFSSFFVSAQTSWRNINTVEEAYTRWPNEVRGIFENLNLDKKGLEEVKMAYQESNYIEASKLLLEYYKAHPSVKAFKKDLPTISDKTNSEADSIYNDIFTFQRVVGKVPRLPDGHLNWNYNGPEDDIEWAWALNRHYPISYLLPLYYETGNPKYANYIDDFIKDWIIKSWPYPAVKSSTAMWRGLEVSFRVKTWAQVFYGLMGNEYISPATKLLILASLPEHAHYARNFHAQNNWLTMEISGLATVAAFWPEYKESREWFEYAKESMIESMKDQIYPDGVQTELTSSYHYVSLNNFNQFLSICKKANIELPEYYTNTLADMWRYMAFTMRPDGYGLLNNDADRISNRNLILNEAKEYNRPDWEYIATNGKSGSSPKDGPSYFFPWAGHLISRSGYDENAQWSFFDMGPWGSGHQHNDKLHLSIAAYGKDFLVDGGRFAYRGEVAKKFRRYALGSQSHNVVLIDGKGQAAGPKLASEEVSDKFYKIADDFDFGYSSFDSFIGLEDSVKHTRAMFYVRGNFWVVVDQITTKRPRKIETLWHWNPSCSVQNGKKAVVVGKHDNGSLTIIPVGKTKWEVKNIKGQEEPEIQGWYSEVYNHYVPNVASVYSTNIDSSEQFVWLLFPSEEELGSVNTKIVSTDDSSVKLKVTHPGKGSWEINIPFQNSSLATLRIFK